MKYDNYFFLDAVHFDYTHFIHLLPNNASIPDNSILFILAKKNNIIKNINFQISQLNGKFSKIKSKILPTTKPSRSIFCLIPSISMIAMNVEHKNFYIFGDFSSYSIVSKKLCQHTNNNFYICKNEMNTFQIKDKAFTPNLTIDFVDLNTNSIIHKQETINKLVHIIYYQLRFYKLPYIQKYSFDYNKLIIDYTKCFLNNISIDLSRASHEQKAIIVKNIKKEAININKKYRIADKAYRSKITFTLDSFIDSIS